MASTKDKLTPYQCCWCQEKILWSEILILKLQKPTTPISSKTPQFQEQNLYCHIKCISDKLSSDVPLLFR